MVNERITPIEALERVYQRDQEVYFKSKKKIYGFRPDRLECQVVMYDTEDMDVVLLIDMNDDKDMEE